MLKTGILNPSINSLLSRVRHTNTLVIADRGFPFWTGIEVVDISLVDGIPLVLDVVGAILANFSVGAAFMAQEFLNSNPVAVQSAFARAVAPLTIQVEAHVQFKTRVPKAIGLIRIGDATPYANII